MNTVASPRHPWKALAVVIAAFAVVHGAGAHVFSDDHDSTRVIVGHHAQLDADDEDCPQDDVHFDDHFPFYDNGPDDQPAKDATDHVVD